MTKLFDGIKMYFLQSIPDIRFTDVLEMIILAFILYHLMLWIKNTRAWVLLKGILVLVGFFLLAYLFQMNTILWLADKTINVGIIAVVIIFQPELRRALEQLGRNKVLGFLVSDNGKMVENKFSDKTMNEIVKACFEMSKVKTGALIVIERKTPLAEFERTGIVVDGVVTSQLLLNIFEHNTPLHDGAVVVRGNRIVAATCYLPLSDNMTISKDLGTRHRAGVGVSEVSDSITIIVSEETGNVSVAFDGGLKRGMDPDTLREELKRIIEENEVSKKRRLKILKGRQKNEKKLTNNLLLKIFSVIAAFLLWIVVINIDNPTDTFTISNIPLTVLNEQEALKNNNLTYEFVGEPVASVEVTARRTDRRKITADDFEATVDMSEVYGATGSVAVNITVVDNKTLIRSWTQVTRSIKVNVEEMQTQEFDIQVIRKGELADSYTVDENGIVVSPGKVKVTAPKSIMETIDHAGVVADVEGKSDNILVEGAEIKLYKANGQEVDMSDERLTMNTAAADVSLPVAKTNQIGIDVKVNGQEDVAEGYKYITYKCSPQTVSVTGAKSLIANLEKIVLEEDLTGKSENITKTYKISDYLPEGLELADGQPDTVEVVFQIEKLTEKSFLIGKNKVNMIGTVSGLSYHLGENNAVEVVLRGLSEDLEKVKTSDISVTLDVSSISSSGSYVLEPLAELSDTYRSYLDINAESIRITVSSLNTSTDPSGGSNGDAGSDSESGNTESADESSDTTE